MKLGLSLAALAGLQLAAGLVTQLVVLGILGAGPATDAWIAAQAVPVVAFSTVSVALQGAWQARLAVAASQPAQWLQTQRAAQGQVLLLFGTTTVLLAATATLWTGWLLPGFAAEQLELTVRMTRLLLVGALLNGQALLLTTALRARGRFIAAEVIVLSGAVAGIVLTAATLTRFGIEAAAWASLAKSLVVCLALWRAAGRPLPAPRTAWGDRESWRHARPILMGSTLYKTGPLVDRYWTSLGPAGGMTTFNLVHMAMSALASVIERALSIPVIPRLARLAAAGDPTALRRLYRGSVLRIAAACAAVLAALLALYPVWPQLVGPLLKQEPEQLMQAWWLCLALVGYLYPAAAGSAVVGSFYAYGDTTTPVRVGVAGFAASLLLKAIGFQALGLMGLALATVAQYFGNMLVLCWLLERRLATEGAGGAAR